MIGRSQMEDDGRQRRDAVANRQAVIEAAAEVLRENPDATMAEIAEHADLGRSTIYRHFASRDELFVALITDVAARSIERTGEIVARGGDLEETLRAIAELSIEIGLRYPFLHALHREALPIVRPLIRKGETPFLAYMAAAQSRGELRSDQPVHWIANVQNAVTTAMVGDVLAGRFERAEAGRILGDSLVAMAVAR